METAPLIGSIRDRPVSTQATTQAVLPAPSGSGCNDILRSTYLIQINGRRLFSPVCCLKYGPLPRLSPSSFFDLFVVH